MKKLRAFAASLLVLASAACATKAAPDVIAVAQPDEPPRTARTSFQNGLSCMDGMFVDFGWNRIPLLVSGVPDHTGKVLVGSTAWLQSSFGRMSTRSQAFRVVDYDPLPDAPEQALYSLLPPEMQNLPIPAMYVRGAISGYAESVVSNIQGGSIAIPNVDGAISRDKVQSIVSVDLSAGVFLTRTLINRAFSSNELTLTSRQRATEVGGEVAKFGIDYNFQSNEKDSLPQAIRTLIDLGAIELAGRITAAPYWECLGSDLSQPDVDAAARDVYADMVDAERVGFAQRRLSRLNAWAGPPDGRSTPEFQQALTMWQQHEGLVVTGVVDFDTYRRMATWKNGPKPLPAPEPAASPAAAPSTPSPKPTSGMSPVTPAPLALRLALSTPRPQAGQIVTMKAGANRTAFLYCYVLDADRKVARVFPNRDQPDAMLRGGGDVVVPPPTARFELVAAPTETITCFASDREVGAALPDPLRSDDLTPLPVSMDALAAEFRKAAERIGGEITAGTVDMGPKN